MFSNLERLRKQRGLTQAELAEAAGISRVSVADIESGRRDDVKLSTIKALAAALQVDNLLFFPTKKSSKLYNISTKGGEEMVHVLQITIGDMPNQQKYYLMDLKGSLSRNVVDSMLFFDEVTASSYAGTLEGLVEKKTGAIATVSTVKLTSSGIIPKTVIECISCP